MKNIRCINLVILVLLLSACSGELPATSLTSYSPTYIPSASLPTEISTAYPAATEQKQKILEETIIFQSVQTNKTDWSLIPTHLSENDYIWDLTTSPDGSIWIAASNGVWRYDGQDWKVFTSQDGLPINAGFMGIASDSHSNVVVAACAGGIYRFSEGKTWLLFSEEMPRILQQTCGQGLFLQDDGKLWMGIVNPEMGYIPGPGVVFFDSQQWHIYSPDEIDWNGTKTEKADIPFTDVIKILPSQDGRIWFETNVGISSYDGKDWVSYSFSDVTGIVPTPDQDAVHKQSGLAGLVVSADGAVWVGTDKGVARLNDSIWTLFNLSTTSENTFIVPLAAGSDGSTWFAASSGQLLRFDGNSWWSYLLPSEFEPSWRLAAVGADQSLWLGNEELMVRYLAGGMPIQSQIPTPVLEKP